MQAIQEAVEAYVVPLQLVLGMLGMGATLSARDFLLVAREAKGVCIGLALQLVFMPALTVGFVQLFDLAPGWAAGLLLIAVVPGGVFSNLLTFLGRGNVPLSVSVTLSTTLACLVTVPVLLRWLAGAYLPPGFAMPAGHVMREISLYLLLPLAVGMLLFRFDPARAQPIAKWSIRISTWLIAVVVVSSIGSGRIEIGAYGFRPPLLLALFGTLVAVLVPWLCRLLRRYDDDTVALGIEVSVRNIGLALLLIRFFFPGAPEQGHVLYTCLFYGGMQLFMALPIALRHRAGRAPVLFLPRRPRPQS